MTPIIILIGLIIALNCVPLLIKRKFPKAKKVVGRILVATTILFLIFTVLKFYGYNLKGNYTFQAIAWSFLVSAILFFTLFKNTKKKLLTVLLLTPLVTWGVMTPLINQVVYEQKFDDQRKIVVTTGGFLACGEIIFITQTKFGIFDKEVLYLDNICLTGIDKIEFTSDTKHLEFLIHHNGELDSENPYLYTIERDEY
ncbi:hypothetical protein OO013_05735 [Mangrovivirga sp. M17]|uniref:Uncharacterized protein n=1 Tax=Mangrovivirga halotolerans TaxID=2993936 RepID=A0ABT3RP19_9BACT|nr:hypothetical protein [Mangrovivirga halotolerans]MCX2743356.1 hypothetical protein [Mangrovivirga halotolerans]